jgi:SPP1 gp7 family putative phage head morphogenesis protein
VDLTDRIVLLNVRLLQVEKKINLAVKRRLDRMSAEFDNAISGFQLFDNHALPDHVVSVMRTIGQRLVDDVMIAIRDVLVRFADAINRLVIGGPATEQLQFSLTTFVDRQDEERIDDTFFQLVGDVVGITEDEAREIFSTLMLWGLRIDQLWTNWLSRYLLSVRSNVAAQLAELRTLGIGGEFDGAPVGNVRSSIRTGIDNASRAVASTAYGATSAALFGVAQQLMLRAVSKNPRANLQLLWCSILDDRICQRCRRRHGSVIEIDDGTLSTQLPPLHAMCRCFLLLTRDGVVIGTYADWVARQSGAVKKSLHLLYPEQVAYLLPAYSYEAAI